MSRQPRTKAGRQFVRDGDTVNPLETVLAIEAECELDVERLRQAMNAAGLGMPYIDADTIEVEDAQRVIDEYARLAPQERRDKEQPPSWETGAHPYECLCDDC